MEPERVRVPEPCLVRLPPVPEIWPETVVLVLSPPAVRVLAPSWKFPAPAMEATVLLLFIPKVAPLSTMRADEDDILTVPDAKRVPSDTMVAPV